MSIPMQSDDTSALLLNVPTPSFPCHCSRQMDDNNMWLRMTVSLVHYCLLTRYWGIVEVSPQIKELLIFPCTC